MSHLTGQVLQSDFRDIGDGAQAVPLRALPLIDGLSVDGVPELLSALRSLILVYLQKVHGRIISKINMNRALPLSKFKHVDLGFFFSELHSCLFIVKAPKLRLIKASSVIFFCRDTSRFMCFISHFPTCGCGVSILTLCRCEG